MVRKNEKVRRKVSIKRYIGSLMLVAFVLLFGLLLGILLSNKRIDYMLNEMYDSKLDLQSTQLQSLYLQTMLGNMSCKDLYWMLEKNLDKVWDSQKKVDLYLTYSDRNSKILNRYKRDFIQVQIMYWIMHNKVRKMCKLDSVSMLYFYSEKNCKDCGKEGLILEYLKKKFGQSMLLFWIDSDFTEEPMVSVMKKEYNVTNLPTIVIEDKVIHRFMTKDEIIKEICSKLKNSGVCKEEQVGVAYKKS